MCIFVDWNNSSINMKKFILIVAALFVGTLAQAQITANGGYIHAFENSKYRSLTGDAYTPYQGSLDGFYVGANYYYSLDRYVSGLAVLPGANISALFGRHAHSNAHRVSELALNIPVHASYTYKINDNFHVFGQTGPAFQFAFTHNVRDNQGTTYSLLKKNNLFGESRTFFNLFWGITAGVEVSELLRIEVGFDFGFLNQSLVEGYKVSRNFLHFGVGYLF